MHKTAKKHFDAINADCVTRSNVIGLRKAFNQDNRRSHGWSVAHTFTIPRADIRALFGAICVRSPKIVGELHDSGLAVLRNKRYAKRLAAYADIIAAIDHFRLIGFEQFNGDNYFPIYRAITLDGRSITFYNIPWQANGNGPEIL